MKQLTPYLTQLTQPELNYYKQQGVNKGTGLTLLYKKLVTDYENGLVTLDDLKGMLTTFTDGQKQTIYDYVLGLTDLFDPQDNLMELLDLLDPDYQM